MIIYNDISSFNIIIIINIINHNIISIYMLQIKYILNVITIYNNTLIITINNNNNNNDYYICFILWIILTFMTMIILI